MADETNRNETQQQDLGELLRIRREKLKALQDEGRDPFQITKFDVTHHTQDIKDNFDAMEGTEVSVAGRLMSKRGMGKVSFCDLQDKTGRIQIYARKDEMDEDNYNRFKKYDIGDIVGVKGEVFRTQRGEMSVRAREITLLSKSLRPLPEKFHGLTDKEIRYRQRYVDLIMNPESKRNFEIRSKFVAYLRRYLDGLGVMEVETPVLSPIAGGANARPFITHHNAQDIDMYMRIATELHLKRLIVGGMERVYEVGRIFRNEGMDTKHNPEFTTCELYQAFTNLDGMMDILEGILSGAAKEILGTYQVQWLGHEIDLTPSWQRVTMADAVKDVTGADFMACVLSLIHISQVAYKETSRKAVDQDTKYARQSGGKGQYGHVKIHVEPNESGKGYEFVNAVVGGAIPKEYIPAIDAGIQGAMLAGVVAGYPVVDVKVTLFDGSYHEVDSSEMAFKIAGSMAFKEAMRKADPTLLEPIMKVCVIVPDEYMGDVIGDINSRRGQIQGYEMRSGAQQIDAFVPLAEMFGYATDLRSRTQGRGQYTMEPSHYIELPKSLQEKLISKRTGRENL